MLVSLATPLTQFCVCRFRKSIREGLPTIPFYERIPRSEAHQSCSYYYIHPCFENRKSWSHPGSVFYFLLNCCNSPSLQFPSLSTFFCCAMFYFWSSSLFSVIFSFLLKFFLFALAHHLLVVLSLSLMISAYFFFAVPFSFILSLSFFLAFFLSLTLFPPFSLFFFSRFRNTVFFSLYILILIQFLVSYRFSYGGFLMFS